MKCLLITQFDEFTFLAYKLGNMITRLQKT